MDPIVCINVERLICLEDRGYFCRMKISFVQSTAIVILLLAWFRTPVAHAQSTESEEHCQEHGDHFHDKELGLSTAPVWFVGSDEPVALGLHAHFIKRLGEAPFGIGLGVEYIADEHQHQTYSVLGQWTPIPALHLVIAPGVALEQEEGEDGLEAGWACHFEVVREFEIGSLDVGPSLEYAIDAHGAHVAIGLHIGIPFE